MTDELIALQKRADDAMTILRNSGHRSEAYVILEMRQALYAALSANSAAMTALRGGFPMESER